MVKKISFMGRCKKTMKSVDMYGERAELNMFDKGPTHNTLPGGIFSIVVMTLLVAYVCSLVLKLVKKQGDIN